MAAIFMFSSLYMCVCECVVGCVCAFLYAVKCNAYREKSEKKASRGSSRGRDPAPAAAATVARTTNCGQRQEGNGGMSEGEVKADCQKSPSARLLFLILHLCAQCAVWQKVYAREAAWPGLCYPPAFFLSVCLSPPPPFPVSL